MRFDPRLQRERLENDIVPLELIDRKLFDARSLTQSAASGLEVWQGRHSTIHESYACLGCQSVLLFVFDVWLLLNEEPAREIQNQAAADWKDMLMDPGSIRCPVLQALSNGDPKKSAAWHKLCSA